VTIRLRHDGKVFSGHAANTDIIVASAQAYIGALNRLYAALNPEFHTAYLETQTINYTV
jgi:2-isopropylmalate synthase